MKIGILGVGHLGAAIARGYAKAGLGDDLLLSPRGAKHAAALAGFHGIALAASNEELARQSDVVIVAVRPADVVGAIRMLPWREDQTVICVAAGISSGTLRGAVHPAAVVRAMPVMAVEVNESAIPIFPDNARAVSAMRPLGRVSVLPNEEAFAAVSSLGAWYAWLFALTGATADQMIANGVPTKIARTVSADMMRAAGTLMSHRSDADPTEILQTLATPGGITEAGLQVLRQNDAMTPWNEALAAALKRLQELEGSGR